MPSWYSCNPANCTGDCACASTSPPDGLAPEDTPQFIVLTVGVHCAAAALLELGTARFAFAVAAVCRVGLALLCLARAEQRSPHRSLPGRLQHDDAITADTNTGIRAIIDKHTNRNGCNMPATFYVLEVGTRCELAKAFWEENSEVGTAWAAGGGHT